MSDRYTVLESWPACEVVGEPYVPSWFIIDDEIDDAIDPWFDNEADAVKRCAELNDPPIRFTPEHGDSNVAPASHWLRSWRNDDDATEAIRRAVDGCPSRFMAPGGMIYVSLEG